MKELEQHMLLLLADPKPLERAPAYFLEYWLQLLGRIAALVEAPRRR
jgi:hypothetical protein